MRLQLLTEGDAGDGISRWRDIALAKTTGEHCLAEIGLDFEAVVHRLVLQRWSRRVMAPVNSFVASGLPRAHARHGQGNT